MLHCGLLSQAGTINDLTPYSQARGSGTVGGAGQNWPRNDQWQQFPSETLTCGRIERPGNVDWAWVSTSACAFQHLCYPVILRCSGHRRFGVQPRETSCLRMLRSTWPDQPQRESLPSSAPQKVEVSEGLRITALALRALFIILLIIIAARVSIPQSEHIWSVYETPGDLVRLGLGAGFCLWVVFHMFQSPKDTEAYRTWLYFSLVGVPFALICLIAIW